MKHSDTPTGKVSRVAELFEGDAEAFVGAVYRAGNMDAAADYLTRGRALAGLDMPGLTALLDRVTAAYVADTTSAANARALDDAQAEFRLRGVEPPLPTFEQLKRLIDCASRALHTLLRHAEDDPEGFQELISDTAIGTVVKAMIEPGSNN